MQVFSSPVADEGMASNVLAPSNSERVSRLRNDLSLGLPIVLQDEEGSALVALIEAQTEDRMAALCALGKAELVLTRRRAAALDMDADMSGDEPLRFDLPEGPGKAGFYGGSAQASEALRAAPETLTRLGRVTPIDRAAVALARASAMLPAFLVLRRDGTQDDAERLGLLVMRAKDVLNGLEQDVSLARVSSAALPMELSQNGRIHVFKTPPRSEEHYAIEIGTPDPRDPVTVRLHSACFTGDVLGSRKCDCGSQLRGAMQAMVETGGVLLYLNQEGRGIGMANKMRAYALQEAGLDTVEANHWLGFEDDERDFRIGAQILHRMGITRIRLMTNNPAKIAILTSHGIEVLERVPLHIGQTTCNEGYLATKAAKSGHLMP